MTEPTKSQTEDVREAFDLFEMRLEGRRVGSHLHTPIRERIAFIRKSLDKLDLLLLEAEEDE